MPGIAAYVAIVTAIILICLQLFIGGLWVTGYPASDRMDDHDEEDDNYRPSDYARYYYVMGLLLIILCVISLAISAIPFPIVQSIGCAMTIVFSLIWIFIVTQVHAESIGNLQYPDCTEAYDEEECSGDKINFVATFFFIIINSMQVAHGVAFSHHTKSDD